MKFDHIGMVVSTLSAGREQLGALFQIAAWTDEFADPINKVFVQFGKDPSGICYELVAPFGEDSPSARAAKQKRDVLNHMAYLVDSLETSAKEMRRLGGVPVTPARPAVAYGGKRIQFFLTKSRFLLELIEASGHEHVYHPTHP